MLRVLLVSLLLAVTLHAAPVDCSPGTLSDYISLGSDGCMLGSRTVSDFSLSDLTFGSEAIDPAAVSITPIVMPVAESLVFGLNAMTGTGLILESIFSFRVLVASNQPQRISLQVIDPAATGDGVVVGITDLCADVFVNGECTAPVGSLVTTFSAGIDQSSDSRTFGALNEYHVLQDFVLDAGLSGTAALGSAQLTFQTIPEPATYATMAAALFVISVFLRRNRR